jgi:sugar/nucleoside kinase (ribokinase family)
VNDALDYVALGHVTLDRQPDGSVLPGGTVLFAALQAARLGLRAGIVTAGRPADLDAALAPYRAEVAIELHPTAETTTFTNAGVGAARRQTLHAWAGPVQLAGDRALARLEQARIVHLGPVAREVEPATLPPLPAGTLVGATPQGWLRRWGADGAVSAVPLELSPALTARFDAFVLSETERALAADTIEAVRACGGLVVVTRGAAGCLVLAPDGRSKVPALRCPLVDDTGAGDIFAASFFVALAEGRSPVAAARFANAAAGLSIGGPGVTAIASRDAIERAMRQRWPGTD